jgi:MFS family permease
MLFVATSINYMDRQVIAILKPTLEHSIGMTEISYGYIVDAFQIAYAIGLLAAGRLIDKVAEPGRFPLAKDGKGKFFLIRRPVEIRSERFSPGVKHRTSATRFRSFRWPYIPGSEVLIQERAQACALLLLQVPPLQFLPLLCMRLSFCPDSQTTRTRLLDLRI